MDDVNMLPAAVVAGSMSNTSKLNGSRKITKRRSRNITYLPK